ncbi:MAG TPA: response regulator [Terriglobia bacterium]|nr:response regulator [Terriglobia bacterium]
MKRTILLADDSPTIRRLVRQTFAEGSYEIVEVSNGEAAIKRLDEVRPSIVLADIYMPGKNGYEVCSHVRNHATLGDIPVVLLVGAFDAFDEEVARQSGATANITKPFEPGALIELVKSLVPVEEEPEPEPVQMPVQMIDEEDRVAEPEPEIELKLEEKTPAPAPEPTPVPVPPSSAPPASEDLLGLETIFKDEPEAAGGITEEDIDRIADRVIQRLSAQVIESIAWDIVPDITEKIVREELKRIDES